MVNRLQVWFFLLVSATLIAFGLLPMVRVALGIDDNFSLSFNTVVMFFIAGLMAGLTAMILMVRRQPLITHKTEVHAPKEKLTLIKIQTCGLLLYSGIPLANFLLAFWLWLRHRHTSVHIDEQGREMLNFQITIYLYLLLSLFLVFVFIGIFTTQIILLLHLIATLFAIVSTTRNKQFKFPASIKIS